jgi:predicted ATPase/DNA-binding CsgD family transcriptional regulator
VAPPASLPAQLTSFIGRSSAIELVRRQLVEHRLVSVVGPGGCGKTRLAIEVGRDVTGQRPDGVFFVDLSGISDPGLVPAAVLGVLGLRAAPGRDPVGVLVTQLSERDVLVVLDNCEHLVDACASLAGALVLGCPRIWALATSRERLGLEGEVTVPVGGLELPDQNRRGCDGWLENSEAGRLFIDRAMTARPGFVLDRSGVVAVAQICERLDGIPLALELAAARARLMSVHAIAAGLSDRFHLLVGSGRAGPSRQKTLLASIEWSCALLREEERALLRRLSVFASGFGLAAAEAVGAGGEIEDRDVLGLLTSLVDKSLVQVDPGTDRFRLHETTRAYAATALDADGGTKSARDRHLGYFAGLAKAVQPKFDTREVAGVLSALTPDLDNVRAGLDWGVASAQFDAAAQLLGAAGRFFTALGLWSEGWARCERLLATELAPLRRAGLLGPACQYQRHSDPSAALLLALELTALGRSLRDDQCTASGLFYTGNIQAWAEPDEALKTADEAIGFARRTGQHLWEGANLHNKAWAYFWLGRPEEAFSLAEASERAVRDADWLWAVLSTKTISSIASTCSGRLAMGLDEAQALLQLSAELSAPTFACFGERHRGETCMYLGDAAAAGAFARARAIAESIDDPFNLASADTGLGHLHVSLGQDDDGYEILEAANAKLEALGFGRTCVNNRAVLAEAAIRRGDLSSARHHLDASTWRLPRAIEPAGAPVFRAEARLARAEGEPARAHGLACDGLSAAFEGGHVLWAIDLLELVAITCADLGDATEAARLLGAAERQRRLVGYVRPAPHRDEVAPVASGIQVTLGPDLCEQKISEGRTLSLEEAVGYARRGRGAQRRPHSGWESLTPAELKVVFLVGQHLTNAEIAERLFLSTATVKGHLNRVFAKVGVRNRGQLAAAAHQRETA